LKILILKPSSLGDVVQALPVLRLIKKHLPRSEIYWWIASNLAPLLEGDPDLKGLIPFERRRWAKPANLPEVWRSIRKMRKHQFDWVIDLQCLARSGAFAWLANGQLTIGLDEPREGARGFYDRIARRSSFHTHAVDWYLSVLPLLKVPVTGNFDWLPPRPAVAGALREKWGVDERPLVSIQPGARWLNKRWPVQYYSDLLRLLAQEKTGWRFAILGGSEDKELGRIISSAMNPTRCLDLTGKLSLPEMTEWLRLSALLITNDTGPMHVAAALGRPVVAIFGPTEPRRTGPYGQLHQSLQLKLPCVPCLQQRCWHRPELECLEALSPAIVLEKIRTTPLSRGTGF
jgi:lipopolysaccharide heptosyltransferase II